MEFRMCNCYDNFPRCGYMLHFLRVRRHKKKKLKGLERNSGLKKIFKSKRIFNLKNCFIENWNATIYKISRTFQHGYKPSKSVILGKRKLLNVLILVLFQFIIKDP